MTSLLGSSTGTPGSDGTPVTPSSTPRASTTTEEPRQIKTEPDTHSLYSHHSAHAQVGPLFSQMLNTFSHWLLGVCTLESVIVMMEEVQTLSAHHIQQEPISPDVIT